MKTLLISGFDGRMGQECARLAPEYDFAAREYAADADGAALLDFSHPDCLAKVLACPLPLVIGTTGYTAAQQETIRQAAQSRPIFQAANFSPGVYLLGLLAEKAKSLLPDWDVSLAEIHHAGKADRPSGTAQALMHSLQIFQVLSIRGGTVPGIHEIGFYGPGEHLGITHTAESRAVFAHGALQAANWITDKGPGFYGMRDLYKNEWR